MKIKTKPDNDDSEPSYEFTGSAPDMDPDDYFALKPTPEGMDPIVDPETRMCIGYYDKEGAIYDYEGVFTGHYMSNCHASLNSDESLDKLDGAWEEVLLPRRIKPKPSIIRRTFKKFIELFKK